MPPLDVVDVFEIAECARLPQQADKALYLSARLLTVSGEMLVIIIKDEHAVAASKVALDQQLEFLPARARVDSAASLAGYARLFRTDFFCIGWIALRVQHRADKAAGADHLHSLLCDLHRLPYYSL